MRCYNEDCQDNLDGTSCGDYFVADGTSDCFARVRHPAKAMTLAEIMDHADMAETCPGSGVLDWGEVSFAALAAWVAWKPNQYPARTETFDVESVQRMFEDWWSTTKADRLGQTEHGKENGR